MNQIYIGSMASNLFFLLHENGLRFLIGFLIFCRGFLLMILFLYSRKQDGRTSFTDLGAFFVCAGYWVMVESNMMQFFIPYSLALTNSSIFALTLLPVFSSLYYYNSHARIYKRIAKSVVIGVTVSSVVFALISCFNPMLPLRILPFCAFLELIFYLGDEKSYHQSSLLTIGLLLFCVFMVIDSVQNLTQVYQTAIKVDTLSVLAYVDSMTGLKNRTAFLEELSNIETEKKSEVSIAMYDVNSLKLVNDTKGHLVGDALLRHSAKVIKASLRAEDLVFRIGGDEFIAILLHGESFDSSNLELRLLDLLQKENHCPIKIAIPCSLFFSLFKVHFPLFPPLHLPLPFAL